MDMVEPMLLQSAMRFASLATIPFGLPVDPDVSLTRRASDGSGGRSVPGRVVIAIDRDEYEALLECGEPCGDEVDGVGELHRDRVARGKAGVAKLKAQCLRSLQQVGARAYMPVRPVNQGREQRRSLRQTDKLVVHEPAARIATGFAQRQVTVDKIRK